MFYRRITSRAQIWTLPKLTLVYSISLVASLQNVLVDSYDGPALSLPEETPRSPQEFDVEQILIAPIGELFPRPHLMVCAATNHIFSILTFSRSICVVVS